MSQNNNLKRLFCIYFQFQIVNLLAAPASKYKMVSEWFLKTVAGQAVEISAFNVLYTASAFRSSGTTQLMCLQRIIAEMVSESA